MSNFNAAKTIEVDAHADGICCDGGNPALGHPKVWLSFNAQNSAQCSYCDRIFVKKT